MRRFITPECLHDQNHNTFYNNVSSGSFKRWIIAAPTLKQPKILDTIRKTNFQIHPTSSFYYTNEETTTAESQSLQTFWRGEGRFAESQATVSMETESRTSTSSLQTLVRERTARELKTTAQQTEISCPRDPDELTVHTAEVILDQETPLAGPAPGPVSRPIIPAQNGQISILGSVCALLLQKHAQSGGGCGGGKELPMEAAAAAPDNICRICFGGESAEHLVRPCSCRGTIAAVHRSCLERWLLQAATSYCELCRYHYAVTRTHKWSLMRSVAEWARSGRGRALAADVWRGAALGAASVLGTSRALQACDKLLQAGARQGGSTALVANLTSSVLIGLIGALNGLLTTWMLLKIQEHQISWQTWRDSTLHVRVALAARSALEDAAPAHNVVAVPSDATITADLGDDFTRDPSLMSLLQAQP